MEPILFYTVGYPGAGKTTLARSLTSVLQGEHLRGDKIGLELFRFPTYSVHERRIVYDEMNERASRALRAGQSVLYDAAANTVSQRTAIATLAHEHGVWAVGIWLQVPVATAKARAGTARDAGFVDRVVRIIPPHIFDQYAAAFESPQSNESIITLSGTAPFSLQYRRLARQLNKLAGYRLPPLV